MDAPAAAQHPLLEAVDLHGAHETRHTFATWLEDAGVPARVIDELMATRPAARALATTPPQALVAPKVRDALGEADLVGLNLECCISERGRPWEAHGKPFFFRAPPRAGELLALLATDCVTLANSHALDYGVAAAGRLVLADPLGGGRQPGHGVVSQARTRSKCGASGSSARASYVVTFARGCSSCARSPLTPFFQPAYIFGVQPGRAPAAPPPVRCADRLVRMVRHGALSGRRGRFATRSGR